MDVTNGTGTFFGTEVTTHILARAGEVITIAFAPDAGYALDTVTVDGQPAALTADGTYTFTNVAADHSITVVYATDAWNDKDDTTTGGDGSWRRHRHRLPGRGLPQLGLLPLGHSQRRCRQLAPDYWASRPSKMRKAARPMSSLPTSAMILIPPVVDPDPDDPASCGPR